MDFQTLALDKYNSQESSTPIASSLPQCAIHSLEDFQKHTLKLQLAHLIPLLLPDSRQ